MRRIVTIILSVVMVGAIVAPTCHAEFVEPENAFCIYGVAGMSFQIEAGSDIIDYTFPNGASHFDKPYVIPQTKISQWYSENVDGIHIIASYTSAITFTNPNSLIMAAPPDGATDTEIFISGNDNTPLSLVTKLLALKRIYLFPMGTMPDIAGVTPTPFVNDGSDIAIDDNELNNTINAINDFKPFIQFIFTTVIPWAGVAGIIMLVFAVIRFMLKG